MSTVFVLCEDCFPEGIHPLKVFGSNEEAKTLQAKAIEYDRSKPPCPDTDGEEEWDAFDSEYEAWSKNHPIDSGFGGSTNGYEILELPYQG
ncbi:hypothetical protein [Marinobacterium litorale]|uniref:hypothetical protein n=1 Tax=Marinobacterium litorale TaxID=404770 RepID=UPI000425A6A7|nr:hypothetical protein [Marinobacterium litorale]